MKIEELTQRIEHTALTPVVGEADIDRLCRESIDWKFFGVCIAPFWISRVASIVKGTPVQIVSVIGFPHGNTLTSAKAGESSKALEAGANELDMVINIGALKSGNTKAVQSDIELVANLVHQRDGAHLKVIIETALLTKEEKVLACKLSEQAGADFVKTSTGFSSAGATVDDVKLMRASIGRQMRIKAAGGIRDLDTALAMVQAGADRLGCSSSITIIKSMMQKA